MTDTITLNFDAALDDIKKTIDKIHGVSWKHQLREFATEEEIQQLVKETHVIFEDQILWVQPCSMPYDEICKSWLIEHDMVRFGYECRIINAYNDYPRLCNSDGVEAQNSPEQMQWLRIQKEEYDQEGREKIMYDREYEEEDDE